jgi:hypothetical protein
MNTLCQSHDLVCSDLTSIHLASPKIILFYIVVHGCLQGGKGAYSPILWVFKNITFTKF